MSVCTRTDKKQSTPYFFLKLFATEVYTLSKDKDVFQRERKGWLTQWVVLVLVNTPLPRMEGYACWGCRADKYLLYNPTHSQLVLRRKSSISSKRSIDVFPHRQVYPSASVKALPSSPSFQEQLRKNFLSLNSSQCLHALSFLLISKALVYLMVTLTGIMASWFRGRSVPWDPRQPPTQEKRCSQHNLYTDL